MAAANSGSVGRGKPFVTGLSKPAVHKPLVVVPPIALASNLVRQQAKTVKLVASATR